MQLRRRTLLASSVLPLAGCTKSETLGQATSLIEGPESWPIYGQNSAHTANYRRGSISSKEPSVNWRFKLEGKIATDPVASRDFVVVGDDVRGVVVIPLVEDSLPRWIELPATVGGTPAVDGRFVYAAWDDRYSRSKQAGVSAIGFDGETAWKTSVAAEVVLSPTITDERLYVRTGDSYLAIEKESGEVDWEQSAPAQFTGEDRLALMNVTPAVDDDVAVFPDGNGVTAVGRTDGEKRWQTELDTIRSCPVIADGSVFVSDVKQGVYALELASGSKRWHWPGTGCWSPPSVTSDRVYATEKSDVVALDLRTGELVWRTGEHGLHGSIQSGVSAVGDTIIGSSSSVSLAAVQAGDEGFLNEAGSKRWMIGKGGYNAPLVVDDRILFVEYGGDGPVLYSVS